MAKVKVNLPNVITEDSHFYKEYEDQLKPYLGKMYISYSTVNSFLGDFKSDCIKSKIIGVRNEGSVYTELGGYVGTAIETGEFPKENPHGFTIDPSFSLESLRTPGAEYERLIVIDRGDYVVIGFIDKWVQEEDGVVLDDFKTGSATKIKEYESPDYVQLVLYGYAEELRGNKVKSINVTFIERDGSHIKPPLNITNKIKRFPLEYSKERITFALAKLDKAVEGISSLYTTYQKIFSK